MAGTEGRRRKNAKDRNVKLWVVVVVVVVLGERKQRLEQQEGKHSWSKKKCLL